MEAYRGGFPKAVKRRRCIKEHIILQFDTGRTGIVMLRLRPYKKCDAKYIAGWIKDEVSFRKWCADRFDKYPVSADDINAHYDACAEADNFYEMTAFDESGVTGHLIMRFTDEEKMTLRFGFVIVDDTRRGMGYGKAMLTLALQYAFGILKVEKVTLGVFENNMPAYFCYKAVGFRDVVQEEAEYYEILGERWKCLELELCREDAAELISWKATAASKALGQGACDKAELLKNLNRLHTTDLGAVRIRKNLSLNTDDVVDWCREKIRSAQAAIRRTGKNWYVTVDDCEITVNAGSYTVITAHSQQPGSDPDLVGD